jgi:hypothetical protein
VTVYDAAEATTSTSLKVTEIKVDGGDYLGGWSWNHPRKIKNGIYITVSGTGASAIIEYAETY